MFHYWVEEVTVVPSNKYSTMKIKMRTYQYKAIRLHKYFSRNLQTYSNFKLLRLLLVGKKKTKFLISFSSIHSPSSTQSIKFNNPLDIKSPIHQKRKKIIIHQKKKFIHYSRHTFFQLKKKKKTKTI